MSDGLVQSISAAFISDLVSPGNRATAISLNMASISLANIVGPVIGGAVPRRYTLWLGTGGALAAVLAVFLILPESVTPAAKTEVRASEILLRKHASHWTLTKET